MLATPLLRLPGGIAFPYVTTLLRLTHKKDIAAVEHALASRSGPQEIGETPSG